MRSGDKHKKLINVYSRNRQGVERIAARVDREVGEAQVIAGKWHRVHDSYSGEFIGFRVGQSPVDERGDYDVRMPMSFGAISARDMQVNAGLSGESRTSRMAEDRRLAMPVPEDHVERVRAKVRVYTHVRAVVGDILRVWPRG